MIVGGGLDAPPSSLSVTVDATSTVSSGGTDDWHGRASIKRRPTDGALVLCYRTASAHSVNDGALHIRFSDDNGHTWTSEDTTLDGGAVSGFPMNPDELSSGEDAGEPWLYVAPNGDLLLHMWRVDYGTSLGGTYQARSTDDGHTWSAATGPVQFDGLTEAQNGKTFATDDDFVHDRTIYAGARVYQDADGHPASMVLVTSDDDGTSWARRSTIVSSTELDNMGAQEVGLEYVGNDTIVAMIRDNEEVASYRRVSTDMGETWGTLDDVTSQVDIASRQRVYTRAHLQGLSGWWKDPVLVMVGFVHQTSGSSMPRRSCVWVSRDRGATWDGPHYIAAQTEDAGYGDMFYDETSGQWVVVTYQGTSDAADLNQYRLTIDGI